MVVYSRSFSTLKNLSIFLITLYWCTGSVPHSAQVTFKIVFDTMLITSEVDPDCEIKLVKLSYIDDQVNAKERPMKNVANFRNVLSQCVAVGAVCFMVFNVSNFNGMTAVLLPIIHGDKAEKAVKMSKSEYTWFSCKVFMLPIGAIIVGPVSQVLGSRVTIMIASIITSGCWTTFHLAKSATTMMMAQAATGLAMPFTIASAFVYTAEVSQPHVRGTLMAICGFNVTFGSFFTVLISKFVHWRSVALINLTLSIGGFAGLMCIPNGPYWLAVQGRLSEAKRSLAWLRGWTTSENVKAEFHQISKAHRQNQETLYKVKSSWKSDFALYFETSFLAPLAVIFFIFIVDGIAGGHVIQAYSIKIFEKINAPLDKHTAAIVLESMRVVGATFCILAVHFFGKKTSILLSLGLSCFCYVVIAVVLFVQNQNDLKGQIYLWIPTITIITLTFVTAVGMDKIPNMLNGELFPIRHREVGSAIGVLIYLTIISTMKKVFEYMVEMMTLQGVFLFFAVVGLLGLVVIYLVLPETNGRSLMEIENHFSGVKSLKDRTVDNPEIEKTLVT